MLQPSLASLCAKPEIESGSHYTNSAHYNKISFHVLFI